jgi:peptidoglycan/LPS O-acetylase OafA/YrhL
MTPDRAPQLRLGGFDALRALAALTVLSYHVSRWSGFAPGGLMAPLLWELKGGVAIFFVISGALLYLPYARALRDGRRPPGWQGYARRRAVRILPAYWFAVTVVAIGPFAAGVTGSNLWTFYGLSQVYNGRTLFQGLGVAWSLCVEVTFYAFLPLFAWLIARRGRGGDRGASVRVQLVWIAGAGAASLVLRGLLAGSLTAPFKGHHDTLMVSLPGLLDWFAIGMALAVLRSELEAGRGTKGGVGALARRPCWCLALAALAFLAGAPAQHGDIFLPWYGLLTHAAIGLGAGLLVLAVIAPREARSGPRRLRLGGRALAWLGTVSYGSYLWHVPLLQLIGPGLMPDPGSATIWSVARLWGAVATGAVILGAASWYIIERPGQALLRSREQGPERPDGRPIAGGRSAEIDAAVQFELDSSTPRGYRSITWPEH